VFYKEEFGVKHKAKVSDMWTPRDSGVSSFISRAINVRRT
jgi:hypothetical protein